MTQPLSSTTNQSKWHERCRDLVEFARSLSWFEERSEFYKNIAINLRQASGADSANVRLLSPAQDTFVLYAFNGDIEQELNREYGLLSTSAGRMPQLIETGEPIVFDFANPTSDDIRWERGVRDGFSSAVIIALPGAQGILGAADLLFREPVSWSSEDIEWFRDLGKFVGAVIGNAMLTDNMLSLRISDERQSLSNEIHDSVAQSLSVITLETDSAIDSLAYKDFEMLTRNLDLIKRAGSEVESIVRNQVSNLRTNIDYGEDVTIDQLIQMNKTFCAQWGLPCNMKLGEGVSGMVIPRRSMSQLTRVVNEALVNIVRHAQAEKAQIDYGLEGNSLVIVIEDDGVGFRPNCVSPNRLGLRIMDERLRSIGGNLEITSAPRQGTKVSIAVPYLV